MYRIIKAIKCFDRAKVRLYAASREPPVGCEAVRRTVTNSPLSSLPEPPYERLGQAGVSAVITGHAFAEPKQAQADAGTSGRAARLVNKSGTAKDHAFVSCSILQGTGLFCLFMMEEEP